MGCRALPAQHPRPHPRCPFNSLKATAETYQEFEKVSAPYFGRESQEVLRREGV